MEPCATVLLHKGEQAGWLPCQRSVRPLLLLGSSTLPCVLPPALPPRRWIATYANARTALQARKGIAPAFMAGERGAGAAGGMCVCGAARAALLQLTAPVCTMRSGASWLSRQRGVPGWLVCPRNPRLPPLLLPCAAFRSGAVMGFLLAGNALLVLFLLLLLLRKVYGDDWEGLYEVRALGPSLPSLCCFALHIGVLQRWREVASAARAVPRDARCVCSRLLALHGAPPMPLSTQRPPPSLPSCPSPSPATVWAAPPLLCSAVWAAAFTPRQAAMDMTVAQQGADPMLRSQSLLAAACAASRPPGSSHLRTLRVSGSATPRSF